MCACVRACVRVCVCVRACVRACVSAEVCFDCALVLSFVMGYVLQFGGREHERVHYCCSSSDYYCCKTLTSGLLLGISEVLRSLRRYLRVQSQRHHTIDRLEERGVERGSTR